MSDTSRKSKILIVDDTPIQVQMLVRLLESDYDILVAANGEEALEKVRSQDMPDMILLDVVMPGMDGFETCKRLKADPACAHIPVIMVTALGGEKDESMGFQAGAADYITKPFRPELVKARVKANFELVACRNHLESLVAEKTAALRQEISERKRAEKISRTLFRISNAVSTTRDVKELYESIHESLKKVVDASHFFIALYEEEEHSIEFPFYISESPGEEEGALQDRHSRHLANQVVASGRSTMYTKAEIQQQMERSGQTVNSVLPECWIGMPLKVGEKSIGAIGVQSYNNPEHFSPGDINILHTVSGQVAFAIESKRQEQKLQAVFNKTLQFTGILSPTGRLLDINETAINTCRVSKAEVTGRPFWETPWWTHSPALQDRLKAEVLKASRGQLVGFEATHQTSDGDLRHMDFSLNPVWNENGVVHMIIAEGRDITDRIRMEGDLRESEERLTMALEAISDGIWDWKIREDIVTIDQRLYELFGYTEDEFPNSFDEWSRKVHPDDFKTAMAGIQDHLKGRTDRFYAEFRVKHSSGNWLWILGRGKIVERDKSGRSVRMIGTYTNINQRKAAEQALKESEERFRTLHEASFGGIGIHEKGVIIDANQGLVDMTGFSYEELIGMNGLYLIADEYREMVLEKILSGYERPYDAVGVRKDGSHYPLEIQGKGIPYNGRPVRVTEFRDITERKKFEDDLRESEERYKMLSEVTIEGIIFHDKGVAVDINDSFAKMFAYDRDELLGKNVIELLIIPSFREELYAKIVSGYSLPYEVKAMKKGGAVFPVEIEARETRYKGSVLRVASVRDLSDRKKTEERFIQLQKMEAIGTLAGGIAHDFNNLLGGILGSIGLLQQYVPPENPGYKRIEIIEKIVQRGANLTRQLLGYAREGKYEVEPISLNRLVQDTLEIFGRTRKGIQIHTSLEDGLWTIEGDRTQIEQVLLNFYINAADAMQAGGNLFIKTENVTLTNLFAKQHMGTPGNYVVVSVRDTGSGMDKKTRAKAFDPFFTTKEVGKGTGLGLASAYGIIKNHNGVIDVSSEPGKGSIFTIYLPASERGLEIEATPVNHLVRGSGTVLLVDDEYEFRDIGEEMLHEMGYQVLTAENGMQAVEIFREKKETIDFVILDIIMPVMGGAETFDRLREIRPDIRVLLSSGYSADSEATEIIARGCAGFLQKPYKMVELSKKIEELLKKKAI